MTAIGTRMVSRNWNRACSTASDQNGPRGQRRGAHRTDLLLVDVSVPGTPPPARRPAPRGRGTARPRRRARGPAGRRRAQHRPPPVGALLGAGRTREPREVDRGPGGSDRITRRSATSPSTDARVSSASTRPAADDDHALGERLDLLEVVAGQQHRRAVGVVVAERLPQDVPRLDVETRGRLVEQHQPRAADEREGDREPPLLPAGQPTGLPADQVLQPEPREHLGRGSSAPGSAGRRGRRPRRP